MLLPLFVLLASGQPRATAAHGEASLQEGELVLKAPKPLPRHGPREQVWKPRSARLVARAYYFRTEIFKSVGAKRRTAGYARRGALLEVTRRAYGRGCKRGRWYEVKGGGYVCTRRGFVVTSKPKPFDLHYYLPDLLSAFPYRYAKVTRQGSPLMYRVPTVAEEEEIALAAAAKGKWPEVVDKPMNGIYLLALAGEIKDKLGRQLTKTVYGRVVRTRDLEPRNPVQLRGEYLKPKQQRRLPLAFVYDKPRAIYRRAVSGKLQRVGTAEKHARFSMTGQVKIAGRRYVRAPGGILLRRDGVRLVVRRKRPSGVPKGQKWIHVDLAEQSLTAYEGDRPVFATLVSSGKKGFEPPQGLFRVVMKHVTATMNGPDPTDGWYEVEEVPWTMYYWESYAIHGAYWHNDFGKVRSHGCTNVAAADARWLFYWSSPSVPRGWHGRRKTGTYVQYTAELIR